MPSTQAYFPSYQSWEALSTQDEEVGREKAPLHWSSIRPKFLIGTPFTKTWKVIVDTHCINNSYHMFEKTIFINIKSNYPYSIISYAFVISSLTTINSLPKLACLPCIQLKVSKDRSILSIINWLLTKSLWYPPLNKIAPASNGSQVLKKLSCNTRCKNFLVGTQWCFLGILL